jgi:hypothetical protein
MRARRAKHGETGVSIDEAFEFEIVTGTRFRARRVASYQRLGRNVGNNIGKVSADRRFSSP